MDGVGGTIKNKVFRDVKSEKKQITDAESFSKYADNTMISSLYICLNVMFSKNQMTSRMPQRLPALWGSIRLSGNSMMTMYVS